MHARIRLFLGVLLLSALPLFAQTTSSLTGTVTTAGQPLGGVTVTVQSPALQGTRSAITGDAGTYTFDALPPGEYQLTFERSGMQSGHSKTSLRLSQTSRVDAGMRSGEEITVVAATPSVLDAPQVSTNLTLQQIERLPVPRNQLATAQFAPGVNGNTLTNGQLQISGGPGYDNLVLVNGVVVTENVRGQIRPMYVEDAIQETTLITGAISAEFGRFSGGVVNTITKSGGNELTGSLRDSLSSPSWSAQTPVHEAREDTLNHVWEATVGGYVLRDRLWFFTAGRWAKNDTARTTIAIPPGTNSPASPSISYAEGNDQKRYEAKLTAQIGPRMTAVGSYFGIDTKGTNVRFSNNFYDLASLTTRHDPESLVAIHLNDIVTSGLLAEGHYSRRKFADRSGSFATDLLNGTVLLDRANNNTRFNSPTLCGACDVEHRDNDDVTLDARAAFGTHDLAAGVDRFSESRYANNHQSGSDFSLFVSRVQWKDGVIYPVITPSNAQGGGTFIRWNPILVAPQADDLRTDSAFINDVWHIGMHWTLNAGARFDRNHAEDADGVVSSNDKRITPRLGAQYDLRGDGRHRFNLSFAEYSSRIADSIASANQAAGNAAAIDFAYKGPAINNGALTTPLADVIQSVFDYFNKTQGGTANRVASNLRANGSRSIPGYSTYFDGTLSSPYVREVTGGYGLQLGHDGYVRADYIHRDWRDFYAGSVTTSTQHANTPLGIPVDLTLLRNSNNIRRNYRGVQLQARWSPRRFESGINYTWSKLRGTDEGENGNTGAVANIDPTLFYPEFFNYARVNPVGYLQGDQRHKLRAWMGYDFGSVTASLLQSYDSGLPYSIVAPVNLSGFATNPGYASIPNGLYYFSGRGALRTEAMISTDLALRYALRLHGIELFAQGDLLNIFNGDAMIDPRFVGTTVSTSANSTTFTAFDPRSATPLECPQGAPATQCSTMKANYQLAANFGQALNDQAYQRPRTYRISLGARF
jgi:hypothetical protein